MLEDSKQVLEQLQQIVASANTGQAINQSIVAYDHYATAAMKVLLEKYHSNENLKKIAEYAWELADAMVGERRKRGLGGVLSAAADELKP